MRSGLVVSRHGACTLAWPVPAQTFRDLVVWQQSMHLVSEVYEVCATFPTEERFVLAAQLKRAAISVASNIGEGARRKRRRVFRYHLEVALGSQAEIEVQAEIARQMGFIDETRYGNLRRRIDLVGRLLNRLLDSLQDPPN